MPRVRFMVFCASALVLLLAVASGCGSGSEDDGGSGGSGESVKVGVVAPLSGPVAFSGIPWSQGAELAAEKINEAGGIESMDGAEIDVTVIDGKSDPGEARESALGLVEDEGVSAIIGPYGSGASLGAAPVAEQGQVPMLASGTSPEITGQGYEYVYNINALSSTYSNLLFSFLDSVNETRQGDPIDKIGLIYEDGPYGSTFNDQLPALAKQRTGFEIVSSLSFAAGSANLRPLVSQAVDAGAELLFVGAFAQDVINTLKAVQTVGSDIPVASISGGVQTASVLELGPVSDGALALTNWNDHMANRPELASFLKEYKDKYGDSPIAPEPALGWLAMHAVAAALEAARTSEPSAVKEALDSIEVRSGVTPVQNATFDDEGLIQPQEETVVVAQLQDGVSETVYPPDTATADFLAK